MIAIIYNILSVYLTGHIIGSTKKTVPIGNTFSDNCPATVHFFSYSHRRYRLFPNKNNTIQTFFRKTETLIKK
jgi:hypothetical protein